MPSKIQTFKGTDNHLFPFFLLLVSMITWIPSFSATKPAPVSSRIDLLHTAIDPKHFYPDVLESAILDATNQRRIENGLKPLVKDNTLARSARRYSRDMARRQRIAHETRTPGLETLLDRLEQSGVKVMNATVAENLAVDYCLAISGIPYYLENRSGTTLYFDAKTQKPIRSYTYQSFARQTVSHWMQSPGHRRNLLNREFDSLGVGVCIGHYQGLDAIYVTQHFWGSLEEKQDR